MKTYKITMIFKEENGWMTIETIVNGKNGDLPEKLKEWIARDYINKLFSKHGAK